MTASIDLQIATDNPSIPSIKEIQTWVDETLKEYNQSFELTIRIVDETEIAQLNNTFRKQDKPTNVLAFPCQLPKELKGNTLGDTVICASVVQRQAKEQNKLLQAHWAHMLVHSTLHLLGFDHEDDDCALKMETKEIKILDRLGFSNPYGDKQTI